QSAAISVSHIVIVRREFFDIHPSPNYRRPRLVVVIRYLPAVPTDVEMSREPMVGGEVCGQIPTATSQIADERATAGTTSEERRQAADEQVPLMAVHHVGPKEIWQQPYG